MDWVVFSDLDNTLLDHDTYSVEPAREALDELRRRAIPLVLVTSKTRAEVEELRARIGNTDPFIVENGGAAYLPLDNASYQAIEFGQPYAHLRAALRECANESGCEVKGFGDASVEEIVEWCGLDPHAAALAMKRDYDEPFLLVSGSEARLSEAIRNRGLLHSRGGRFHHILGANDKAAAVRAVTAHYRRNHPNVRTLGLGDGLNDASFLNAVDEAVLMPSPAIGKLAALVPAGSRAPSPGPAGWNTAVLNAIRRGSRSH